MGRLSKYKTIIGVTISGKTVKDRSPSINIHADPVSAPDVIAKALGSISTTIYGQSRRKDWF
jgi:hypothetical protein